MNNLEKILWVFSTDTVLPSDLVGCIYPANFLNIKKLVFLTNHNPARTLDILNPKILIIGKCLNSNIINLAREAKKRNIKIVSIFDDWHFNPQNSRQEIIFNFNFNLSQISDLLVVKSEGARSVIKENLNLSSVVLPDCIRYPTIKIKNDLNEIPNILWFGSSSNHDTVKIVLDEIITVKRPCTLSIVTNITNDLQKLLSHKKYQNIKIELIPFSDHNLIKSAKTSDFISIPIVNDIKRKVKSSNRIIDALNFRRFVIVSKNNFHNEFNKFCYHGQLSSGIEWAYANKEKAFQIIKNGKKYIDNNFTLQNISSKWESIINNF